MIKLDIVGYIYNPSLSIGRLEAGESQQMQAQGYHSLYTEFQANRAIQKEFQKNSKLILDISLFDIIGQV